MVIVGADAHQISERLEFSEGDREAVSRATVGWLDVNGH